MALDMNAIKNFVPTESAREMAKRGSSGVAVINGQGVRSTQRTFASSTPEFRVGFMNGWNDIGADKDIDYFIYDKLVKNTQYGYEQGRLWAAAVKYCISINEIAYFPLWDSIKEEPAACKAACLHITQKYGAPTPPLAKLERAA